MRGMSLRMAASVFDNRFLLPFDSDDQTFGERCESRDGVQCLTIPMIGGVGGKVRRLSVRRRKPFECFGNAAEQVFAQIANPSASSV